MAICPFSKWIGYRIFKKYYFVGGLLLKIIWKYNKNPKIAKNKKPKNLYFKDNSQKKDHFYLPRIFFLFMF
jgi:hypothetical protein